MNDEEAVDVLRRYVRCLTGMPTFCRTSDCQKCELFSDRHATVQALMLGAQALEDRIREPPEVVYCRDCDLEGTIYCKLTKIENARLEFLDHPLDWFCADGVKREKPEADRE